MVLDQIIGNNSKQEEKDKFSKKIFTCAEIENDNQKTMNVKMASNSIKNNLKHIDSAVLFSSSKNETLTRYDIAELKVLKEAKSSQEPPRCFYDPNIMRLNILKYKSHTPETVEAQMKVFREKLQNLMLNSWDPSVFHLLKQYHTLLLNPNPFGNLQQQPPPQQQQINTNFPSTLPQIPQQQINSPRSNNMFGMNPQQAVLDKIPSYDRNMNFFDNITTTATMRPPPSVPLQRFQNPSYNGSHFRQPQQQQQHFYHHNPHKRFYASKPPTTFHDRHSTSYSSSGYFSGNDTRSTTNESLVADKQSVPIVKTSNETKKAELKDETKGREDRTEPEPEWFNFPATRSDFVDLRGFDDENIKANQDDKASPNKNKAVNDQHNYGNTPLSSSSNNNSYRRNANFNNSNRFNNANGYHNINYYQNQQQLQQQQQQVNNFNQRFRNPLHYTQPPNQFAMPANQFPNLQPNANPFFDAWKSGKLLNNQNINFVQLLEQANAPIQPPTIKHISDVEQAILQNKFNQNNSNGYEGNGSPVGTNVPQFFHNLANNWGVRLSNQQQQQNTGNFDGFSLPTQEQLQQHTSEIMKNAMLRKQRDQQYHDENNHQQ